MQRWQLLRASGKLNKRMGNLAPRHHQLDNTAGPVDMPVHNTCNTVVAVVEEFGKLASVATKNYVDQE